MKTRHITLTLLLAGLMGMPYALEAQITSQSFVFQDLPYDYDALEPYIDATTMEIHYSRHHRAYYNNFLNAVKGTQMEKMAIEDIFANISTYPQAVRNNGGGYFNHTLFWAGMTPETGGKPSGKLEKALEKTFGSLDAFKEIFAKAGATRFGSGWAWLSIDRQGNLFVSSTPNQDNPLMDIAEQMGTPLLAMDVWEHAYYLKYQNKRADYIEAFWNVINWKEVEKRYEKALRQLK